MDAPTGLNNRTGSCEANRAIVICGNEDGRRWVGQYHVIGGTLIILSVRSQTKQPKLAMVVIAVPQESAYSIEVRYKCDSNHDGRLPFCRLHHYFTPSPG